VQSFSLSFSKVKISRRCLCQYSSSDLKHLRSEV
jgi:hypothetical protein